MRSGKEVFLSLKNPGLIISLFITTMMIQIASNSVNPILTLYVRDLAGNAQNIAFISGMIASVGGCGTYCGTETWEMGRPNWFGANIVRCAHRFNVTPNSNGFRTKPITTRDFTFLIRAYRRRLASSGSIIAYKKYTARSFRSDFWL